MVSTSFLRARVLRTLVGGHTVFTASCITRSMARRSVSGDVGSPVPPPQTVFPWGYRSPLGLWAAF
jgi:hypothetical protein